MLVPGEADAIPSLDGFENVAEVSNLAVTDPNFRGKNNCTMQSLD
jgi:hypothetical protein